MCVWGGGGHCSYLFYLLPSHASLYHSAILDAFYPGASGATAVARALYGLVNPGGKLPYTVYDTSFQSLSNFTDMRIAVPRDGSAGVGRTYRYYVGMLGGGEGGGVHLQTIFQYPPAHL